MTTGDNSNINCPYCGWTNHHVAQGKSHRLTPEEIAVFTRECWHCKEKVVYQVRMVMSVQAYQQEEADNLKEVLGTSRGE